VILLQAANLALLIPLWPHMGTQGLAGSVGQAEVALVSVLCGCGENEEGEESHPGLWPLGESRALTL
jgi:hypothetical protein